MTAQANIIKQATLNFQFHEPENKFAIPEKVENWFLHKAMDMIGKVCDDIAGPNEYLEIDTIEINLGTLTDLQFENESGSRLKDHLEREIKLVLAEKGIAPARRNSSQGSTDEELSSVLVHFLKNGFLSWKASFAAIHFLEKEIMKRFERNEITLMKKLIPLLAVAAFRKRMAFNFSEIFLQWLIHHVLNHSSPQAELDLTLLDLKTFEAKENALIQLEKHLSASFMDLKKTRRPETLKLEIRKEKSPDYGTDEDTNDDLLDEGIFIANAGTLLMHPFLPALFANLGLTDKNTFKSDQEREKAIWSLHFMVYGHLELDESQVVLPKLIGGIPLHAPLKHTPHLSTAEKEEINRAIEHAIKHWKILKNTGVDSFRETFLQREGHVRIYDQFIEIDVEQKAVDMLMSHLPWTLSNIQLPWLDKKFYVNWA